MNDEKNTVYFNNPVLQKTIDNAKLIIFDVNGLIIDDEPIQLEAVNLALKSMNYIPIDKSYWIQHCVGHRADSYFRRIIYENASEKSVSVEVDANRIVSDLIEIKNQYYIRILKKKIFSIVRKGFLSFIEYLYNRKAYTNLKLAIATSAVNDEAEAIIGSDGLNIEGYFDYIVTGSDIKKSKPDPEIYLKVLQKAKIKPEYGLVFEDSEMGVEAASAAGMNVIAMPNEFTKNQNFKKAKYIISDFTKRAELYSQR